MEGDRMKKYYHFTNYDFLENINNEGLIPINGSHSSLVGDDRKVISVSNSIEQSIIAYLVFLWNYESFIGSYGDEMLEKCDFFIEKHKEMTENLKSRGKELNGKLYERSKNNYNAAIEMKNRILNYRTYSSFAQYWGDGVYLCINGVNQVPIINGGYHDCFFKEKILPENINILLLKNNETGEIIDDKQSIVDYFMASIGVEALCDEYDDTLGQEETEELFEYNVKRINKIYEDKKFRFLELKENFNLIEVPLRSYIESKNLDFNQPKKR